MNFYCITSIIDSDYIIDIIPLVPDYHIATIASMDCPIRDFFISEFVWSVLRRGSSSLVGQGFYGASGASSQITVALPGVFSVTTQAADRGGDASYNHFNQAATASFPSITPPSQILRPVLGGDQYARIHTHLLVELQSRLQPSVLIVTVKTLQIQQKKTKTLKETSNSELKLEGQWCDRSNHLSGASLSGLEKKTIGVIARDWRTEIKVTKRVKRDASENF